MCVLRNSLPERMTVREEECMSETVENQASLSMDEAAAAIGWNKATVYEGIRRLEMKTHKFIDNRNAYLAAAGVDPSRELIEEPVRAGLRTPACDSSG